MVCVLCKKSTTIWTPMTMTHEARHLAPNPCALEQMCSHTKAVHSHIHTFMVAELVESALW